MASLYSTELYVTTETRRLAEEQPLPVALRRMSLLMRVLCFLALGHLDLDDHWKSLQSEEAFETVRSRLCSVLASTMTTASVILALSGVFVTTGSPVSYFNYTSPAPHCLLVISLMLAMIALLTSGSSMIRWVHTDRHWTQEQLKSGGYFVLSYLLSIVTPVFFVAWSLHCFIFAILIAGFSSQSMICRAITALWLVTYIANIGTILMETMWKTFYTSDRVSVKTDGNKTSSGNVCTPFTKAGVNQKSESTTQNSLIGAMKILGRVELDVWVLPQPRSPARSSVPEKETQLHGRSSKAADNSSEREWELPNAVRRDPTIQDPMRRPNVRDGHCPQVRRDMKATSREIGSPDDTTDVRVVNDAPKVALNFGMQWQRADIILLVRKRGREGNKTTYSPSQSGSENRRVSVAHGTFSSGIWLIGGCPAFILDRPSPTHSIIQCVLYLQAQDLVSRYLFLLRGNHEYCRHLTDYLTLKLECKHKYSERSYDACIESFCALPLAAITNKQFLCIHSSLSPKLNTLDDIRAIDRFREPPTHGLACDILWSDTVEDFRQEKMNESFVLNHVRGCSYFFTYQATCQFLERNTLLSIIRAHEAQMPVAQQISHVPEDKNHKFSFCHDNLFSYLDMYNNKAAVLNLPFVGEKITDVLVAVLNTCSQEELEESYKENVVSRVTHHEEARRKIVKNKILAVGRIAQESEKFLELKSISNSSKLPYGMLALGTEGIKDAISDFEDARKSDIANERLPPEFFDAEEAKAFLAQAQSDSLLTTPTDIVKSPVSPGGASTGMDASISSGSLTSLPSLRSGGQMCSPRTLFNTPFKGRHGRQASLGTTTTKRRGLERMISMIQEALDEKDLEARGLPGNANDAPPPTAAFQYYTPVSIPRIQLHLVSSMGHSYSCHTHSPRAYEALKLEGVRKTNTLCKSGPSEDSGLC
ncbi:Metallo-dependent phosphatase-like protein [Suillus subluteus]|nr:Metallo-dependent phosphatase-like protein [Suillus subluteus]